MRPGAGFINDLRNFNGEFTEVRNCIRKAGLDSMVRMIEVPPTNLKARLVRNRLYDSSCKTRQCIICPFGKEGDCMVSGSEEGGYAETLAGIKDLY
ncbi:unnamed protein product [Heligmosomoides polygyrus]|uniref:Radical SAM protein n=1 Tax=Heligmosomoides polygyrus TaxID=6339 RepID=A0A3P7YSK6_HELPZ|nr:unnamed protein product [Heligmosomoides polygyrus]